MRCPAAPLFGGTPAAQVAAAASCTAALPLHRALAVADSVASTHADDADADAGASTTADAATTSADANARAGARQQLQLQ